MVATGSKEGYVAGVGSHLRDEGRGLLGVLRGIRAEEDVEGFVE